jgi:type I restriction enzyme, S subunit
MRTVALRTVTEKIGSGSTPRGGEDSYAAHGTPLIRSLNIYDDGFREEGLAFLTPQQANALSSVTVESGDILLNITGASVARCCLAPDRLLPARVNQHVCIIRPKHEVLDAHYLQHLLVSGPTKRRLLRIGESGGATRQAITKADLQNLEIPLPPLPEQKRIAAILDAADALRAKRRESIEQLDSLVQATFLEMFGDPVTNPKRWPQVELATLIAHDDRINYGVVQPGDDFPGGCPLIRVGDFADGMLDTDNLKTIAPNIESRYVRSRLKGDELLVSCVGSIGTVCKVTTNERGFNIARAVARVPLMTGVNRDFVMHCLRSTAVQHHFAKETRTVSQPTLNIALIKTAPVLTPPLDLQARFASIVESIEQQKARLKAHLAELDTLFASLQSRAFNGELVA